MADARSLGIEGVEGSKKEAIDQNITDIFIFFMERVAYFVPHRDQDVFDGVYKAALENNDAALAAYRERGMIDVFSGDQLPLTVSGKLAADGKFEAAKKLISFGANAELMLVGAASGGQTAFLDPRKNGDIRPWPLSDYKNLRRAMLMVAAFNNQREVVELIARYDTVYFHDLVKGAGLGGHFDYVEQIVTELTNQGDAITGLTHCTFDRLRASLQNKADCLRFLAQFKEDKFRQDMAWRLDSEHLTKGHCPMLPYKAESLVSDANLIRRLMNERGLTYDVASEQVAARPYYARASLAANSLFASAGALAVDIVGSVAALDFDDAPNEHRESCRIM